MSLSLFLTLPPCTPKLSLFVNDHQASLSSSMASEPILDLVVGGLAGVHGGIDGGDGRLMGLGSLGL